MITAKRLEILRDSFVDTICLFLAEHLIKIYRTQRQSDFWNGYASDLVRVRWVSLPLIARRTVIVGCRIESRNSALVGWSFFWVFAGSFRATSATKKSLGSTRVRTPCATVIRSTAEPKSHVILKFPGWKRSGN